MKKEQITGLHLDEFGYAHYLKGGYWNRYVPYYGQEVIGYGRYITGVSPIQRLQISWLPLRNYTQRM